MSDEISTDVSRVVCRTLVHWDDKDWILDNFGMDDWSAVQSRLLRDKRARMVQAASDAGQALIDAAISADERRAAMVEAKRLREEAMSAAGNVAGLRSDEVVEILNRPDGMSVFLFVMFERRYPGKFTVKKIESMIQDGAISLEKLDEIVSAMQMVLGIDPAGK